MNHRHSAQQSGAISDKCLEFLNSNDLPSTPVNFAVAYELILGKNEGLIQAMRQLLEKNQVDSYALQTLYDDHIVKQSPVQQDIMAPMVQLLSSMLNYSDATCKSASRYQAQLEQGGKALENSANPQEILQALAQATQLVSSEQQQLNARLTAAEQEVKSLKTNLDQLEIEAITDPLTGLYNRKGLERALEEDSINTPKNCIAIFDIDHFKQINDNFGHNFGDNVIRQVAKEIKNHIRGADISVRWGGEEFLMVLRNTDIKGAEYVANKIRETIRALRWKNTRTGEQLPPVTISGGLTQLQAGECAAENIDTIVERADTCLYRAKQGGRNKVCF